MADSVVINASTYEGYPGPPDWSQGPPGPPGPAGPIGPAGSNGERGPEGIQGPAGVAGVGVAGPAGAVGPVGATGATGAVGPAGAASVVPGPAGPAGATMVYRGAWSSGTTYLPLDTVSYNGSSYVATTTISSGGAPPDINASWAMMAQAGSAGTAGSAWYTGAGVPAGGMGVVGDWYLNSTTGQYYSKTGASTWTLQGSLMGPQGNVGPAGPTGSVAAAGDGTAALPSITFASDTNTGFWRAGPDYIGFSTGGVARWLVDPAGNFTSYGDNLYDIGLNGSSRPRDLYLAGKIVVGTGSAAAPSITTFGDPGADTGIFFQPDTIWFTTAGVRKWGIYQDALVGGADNAFDIGQSGANRPRNLYLAGTATIGGGVAVGTYPAGVGAGEIGLGASTIRFGADTNYLWLNAGNYTFEGGNLIPASTSTRDLGIPGNIWRNLYLAGTATVGNGSPAAPAIAFGNDPDTGIFWWTANTIGFAAGGASRWLLDAGMFYPALDNAYDIGWSGNRPRNLYLAGTATVGQQVNAGSYVTAGIGFSVGTEVFFTTENAGGYLRLQKQTALAAAPTGTFGKLYFRDGTNASTLKLVVRAGAGAETTVLDNIPLA